jgi:hypothetical protein
LTAIDVFILLPLFPLLIIAIIWWAPWERWVWKNVPKTITGPYLPYCAFAFWHFHAHWWWVLCAALLGAVVGGVGLREAHASQEAVALTFCLIERCLADDLSDELSPLAARWQGPGRDQERYGGERREGEGESPLGWAVWRLPQQSNASCLSTEESANQPSLRPVLRAQIRLARRQFPISGPRPAV